MLAVVVAVVIIALVDLVAPEEEELVERVMLKITLPTELQTQVGVLEGVSKMLARQDLEDREL
jgi:hypothetical protein